MIRRNWKTSAIHLSINPCWLIFLAQARAKWDIPAIHQQVLASQRHERFVAQALTLGKLKSWDHQPLVDASQQYMRNHIDLDDLERKARYPQPCPINQ